MKVHMQLIDTKGFIHFLSANNKKDAIKSLKTLKEGTEIRWLSKKFKDSQLILSGSLLLIAGLLGWAFSDSLAPLLIALVPLSLATGMLRVSTNSALTKSVQQSEVGGILGLSASMTSFTAVIAPLIGAYLLESISPAAPGVLGARLYGHNKEKSNDNAGGGSETRPRVADPRAAASGRLDGRAARDSLSLPVPVLLYGHFLSARAVLQL